MLRPDNSNSAARPWPMMRGKIAQAPMSQPASPTRVNKNAVFERGVLKRMSEHMAKIARHAREIEQFRHAHPRQRSDDLLHIPAGAKVGVRTTDNYHSHFGRL